MNNDYNVEKKDGVYTIVSFKIPRAAFESSYKELLKEEAKKADVKGFRKGKVPIDIVEPEIKNVLTIQTLEKLTPLYVSEIVTKENLQLLAPPEYVEFPDLEGKGDLELKVKFTTFPDIKLGDFSKIKIKEESTKPKEEEIQSTIDEMFKRSENQGTNKKATNEWAKEIGELYKLEGVKDLKGLEKQIENLLETEKKRIVKQNQEHQILEEAIKMSKIEIPEEAINFEAQEREHSFLKELKNANLSVEDFCKSRDTKFEDLRKSWQKDSKEALEGEILLRTYAKEKKIEVTEDDLKKAVEEIKHNQQQEIPEDVQEDPRWRDNIRNVIRKQKAYKDLISQVIK